MARTSALPLVFALLSNGMREVRASVEHSHRLRAVLDQRGQDLTGEPDLTEGLRVAHSPHATWGDSGGP